MKKKFIVFFIMFVILIFSYKDKVILDDRTFLDNEVISEDNVSKNNIIENSVGDKNDSNDKDNTIYVSALINNEKTELSLEDYIVGVVSCEMPASFDIEALKAMSVAARTYALYKRERSKTLKTTTDDQCYIDINTMKNKWKGNFDKYYKKISNAVNDTKGEYMTYNDKVIIAFYFSISNGKTENVENVFMCTDEKECTNKSNVIKNLFFAKKRSDIDFAHFMEDVEEFPMYKIHIKNGLKF